MAGKRARGGFNGSGVSPVKVGQMTQQPGQNPEGATQPDGMFGQSAQAAMGRIGSAAGAESISESASHSYPTEAQIHTNRVRGAL